MVKKLEICSGRNEMRFHQDTGTYQKWLLGLKTGDTVYVCGDHCYSEIVERITPKQIVLVNNHRFWKKDGNAISYNWGNGYEWITKEKI